MLYDRGSQPVVRQNKNTVSLLGCFKDFYVQGGTSNFGTLNKTVENPCFMRYYRSKKIVPSSLSQDVLKTIQELTDCCKITKKTITISNLTLLLLLSL